MILTDRDLDLLETLALRVRLMTRAQVVAGWWETADPKPASRRLAKLVAAGLLRHAKVVASPLLPLASPVVRWSTGEAEPAWPQVAWRLQSRWCEAPRRISIFFASPRAVALVGGAAPGRVKNECQATHDLHVAQVYVAYRRRAPDLARLWIGEDRFAAIRTTTALPDAALVDATGAVAQAVEFGGRYSVSRLAEFHADHAAQSLSYEIW